MYTTEEYEIISMYDNCYLCQCFQVIHHCFNIIFKLDIKVSFINHILYHALSKVASISVGTTKNICNFRIFNPFIIKIKIDIKALMSFMMSFAMSFMILTLLTSFGDQRMASKV